MKRIFLLHISLVLFLWLIPSGAVLAQTTGMTDNEVYEFIVKEKDKGTSQQQIAVKLVQRGVQMEQIKRVRDKYLKESQSDLPNVRSVTGQDRLRKNNGDVRDKKQKQPQNIRKRQYKKEDFTDEEYSEFEKRQLRDYTNSLEFLFPDSMSVYGEYDEEKLGKKIIFGHDIFNNKKLTFESGMNIPTPTDYQLGAGDNVFIDIFGASQKNFSSVISPEGCASILWKDAANADKAAETMGITAQRLYELQLIDNIVAEPMGGAHRNHAEMAANLKQSLLEHLQKLTKIDSQELIKKRFDRIMAYGKFFE